MPEWIGHIIGKVRIEKFLARGGMAEVYLGTHLTLDRPVAVKVLHSHIESDPALLARFQREAKVIAGLRHSNIVQILDFDTHEGHPYIVMEYINGLSFSSYLRGLHEKNQKLSYKQIAHLLKSLSSALDYAHAQGVIHRDIKPANILLHSSNGDFIVDRPITQHTEPVITDFGLVRLVHSGTQTASGIVSGTPKYMSPEQARGDKVDHRTDIYSLGIMLYELLAGRVPFDGDSTLAVIYKHLHEPPPPIENISPQLQEVVNRTLAKDPNDRYQSARELTNTYLEAIGLQTQMEVMDAPVTQTPLSASVSKPNPARRPVWIGAAVFGCACLGLLAIGAVGLSAASLFPALRVESTATQSEVLAPLSTPAPTDDGYTVPVTGDEPVGVFRIQDGTSALDQITISGALAPLSPGTQYEAWLIADSGEQRKSLGILEENSAGQFVLKYVDPQSRNLLDGFNSMEITVEPNPDDSPNPSSQVAYSSEIPMGSLMHIRHLLVRIDENPNDIGMAVGLVDTSKLIKESSDAMLGAYEAGDSTTIRANAETIINLIVGNQSPDLYKDWDGDGTVNDPSDGYGILLNGEQAGYVAGVIDHAQLAADSNDSTAPIRMHSGHVVICAQNVEDWSTRLRDLAMQIVQAQPDQISEADVRSASTFADQILDGIDINGNEAIDPIPGEGGAMTAYEHADYMSDMPILAGENQTP